MKSSKWQTHRTRKKSENCKKTKPWRHTTGPKTDAGKQISSQNALKRGNSTADMIALSNALYHQLGFINKIMDMHGFN